jgi:hypothetical protein
MGSGGEIAAKQDISGLTLHPLYGMSDIEKQFS